MGNLYAYEERIVEAEKMDIDVVVKNFGKAFEGLYVDGIIALDGSLSMAEKNCIMAEEIGHALYSIGNILDQSIWINRKQERQARAYAYKKLVPIDDIKKMFGRGCETTLDIAEYFNVPVKFLFEAMEYYYMSA